MQMQGFSPYKDREHAGQVLGEALTPMLPDNHQIIVLGLPRGGVVVAFAVAASLRAPLDVFLVRKLGMPGDEEFAIGAIATGGTRVLNNEAIRKYRVSKDVIERTAEREQQELERRERLYRENRAPVAVHDRTVVLVDDGLATGSTMSAACQALRTENPRRIIAAVPVGSREASEYIRKVADHVVCPMMPHPFVAIGPWYQNFSQTTDDEVRKLLQQASHHSYSEPT